MRKLFILSFFLPLIAWAQSALPPCPEKGDKHNCFGTMTFPNGDKYAGEFRNDKPYGLGTATFPSGDRYVGEFMNGNFHGQGIVYFANGSVYRSGRWENDNLVESSAVDKNRFPFNPPSRVAGASAPQQFPVQSSLPPCPETGVKSDCLGYFTQSDRSQYVGEFKNGKRNGLGIQYRSEGTVAFAGIWQEDHLSMSLALNQRDFPFKKIGITPPLPLPALVSKNLTGGFEMKIRANSDIFPIKAGKVVYVSPKGLIQQPC